MRVATSALVVLLATARVAAADPQSGGITIGYEAETGIASTFVFRGIPVYSTPRVPSSETSLTAIAGGLGPGELSVNVFGVFALQDRADQDNAETEVDLAAEYSVEVNERFTVGGAYQVFLLPKDDPVDSVHEIGALGSMNGLAVTPSVQVWLDPIRQKGVYASAGVAREFAVAGATLEPSLSAGVQKYSEVPGGLNDVTVKLSASMSLPAGLYASGLAAYAYAHVIDGDFVDRSVYWYYLGVGYER